jgi:SAM-dependent methyltransferase
VLGGDALHLPFPEGTFDLVSALDVFEHLEDDIAGFAEVRRVLRPGGYILAAVPAFRFLWSEHDEALGHRRRYVASEVYQKLNRAGFHVVKATYAVTFVFPAILAFRVWRGLFPNVGRQSASYVMLPRWLNRFLAKLLALESVLMTRMSLPVGTSVFAVGRRPDP